MSSSMVEVKERPEAVGVNFKMYFRVVNTGFPEAVEEVLALWVKQWIVGEELVGTPPGRRDGSRIVIRLEIVEGSVWTRAVHDFVKSVAVEGRVAVVQKRSVEGRGIVQGGGGGRRRRRWLCVTGGGECEERRTRGGVGARLQGSGSKRQQNPTSRSISLSASCTVQL